MDGTVQISGYPRASSSFHREATNSARAWDVIAALTTLCAQLTVLGASAGAAAATRAGCPTFTAAGRRLAAARAHGGAGRQHAHATRTTISVDRAGVAGWLALVASTAQYAVAIRHAGPIVTAVVGRRAGITRRATLVTEPVATRHTQRIELTHTAIGAQPAATVGSRRRDVT